MQIVQKGFFPIFDEKMKGHHIDMLSSWRSLDKVGFKKNSTFLVDF
jgi:hypothetical protein